VQVEWEKLTKAGRIKIEDIGQDLLVTTNKVGSVCTLLGEQLQKEAHSLLQLRYMKTLLLAGILLDTKNLDLASKRDIDMATTLLVGSGSLGRNGFYKQCTCIKPLSIKVPLLIQSMATTHSILKVCFFNLVLRVFLRNKSHRYNISLSWVERCLVIVVVVD
jgi:hypothetical protein